MPAIFTHVQFGKEVAEGLPAPLKGVVEAHPQAFYLGTQGPDILFYHKPFQSKDKNPARKKGWDLHAQAPERFFVRAAKIIDGEGEDALKAYVIGFLCHFTLDSTCHPAIDGASVDGLTHGKIESELDKYHLRRLGKKERGFNAATLFFPTEEARVAGAKILGVSEENMDVALRSMRKINGLFSHKCELVHGVCHLVLTLAGMNKSFGEMFLHKKQDERCIELLPKLSKLFDGAIPLAREMITDYFENLSATVESDCLKNDFYRYDYSGNKEEE